MLKPAKTYSNQASEGHVPDDLPLGGLWKSMLPLRDWDPLTMSYGGGSQLSADAIELPTELMMSLGGHKERPRAREMLGTSSGLDWQHDMRSRNQWCLQAMTSFHLRVSGTRRTFPRACKETLAVAQGAGWPVSTTDVLKRCTGVRKLLPERLLRKLSGSKIFAEELTL